MEYHFLTEEELKPLQKFDYTKNKPGAVKENWDFIKSLSKDQLNVLASYLSSASESSFEGDIGKCAREIRHKQTPGQRAISYKIVEERLSWRNNKKKEVSVLDAVTYLYNRASILSKMICDENEDSVHRADLIANVEECCYAAESLLKDAVSGGRFEWLGRLELSSELSGWIIRHYAVSNVVQ